jgi:hypothetical protein
MHRTTLLLTLVLLGVLAASCAQPVAAPSAPVVASPAPAGASPAAGGVLTAQEVKPGDAFNGISCDQHESMLFHIHPHLAIYANGQPVQVPHGIGIGQPQNVVRTAEGPFVNGGSCFSWLHTHTQDGIIHIESPVTRAFTLGDLFAVWGQRLTPTQVGSYQGQVFAYVNGEKVSGDPAAIPLTDHAVIQLNVGNDSPPPQPYTFPPNV